MIHFLMDQSGRGRKWDEFIFNLIYIPYRWLHTELFIDVCVCVCVVQSIHTQFFFCQLSRPRSYNIPISVSISSTQILVSNTPLQQKEPGLLGKMDGSRVGAGNTQTSLGSKSRKVLTHTQRTHNGEGICKSKDANWKIS